MQRRRPLCLWLSGYQGAGKSTLAAALADELGARGRTVQVIDGDAFRAEHSRDLGFSRSDRAINVSRMARAAAAWAEKGSDVVVAAMSPFCDARARARDEVSPLATFFEVHVATPLHICMARDTKGLYAAALCGEVRGLNGIDEPFEPPVDPVIALSMGSIPPAAAAQQVLARLSV